MSDWLEQTYIFLYVYSWFFFLDSFFFLCLDLLSLCITKQLCPEMNILCISIKIAILNDGCILNEHRCHFMQNSVKKNSAIVQLDSTLCCTRWRLLSRLIMHVFPQLHQEITTAHGKA